MWLEEIQALSNEKLLNKLMTIGNQFLEVTDTVESNSLFFLLKDLKREALFRMHYGSKGKSTFSPNEDGDVSEE